MKTNNEQINEPIYTISSYDIYENETLDDYVTDDVIKLTKDFDCVMIVGSYGTWQGRREIIPFLLNTGFSDLTEILSCSIENIEVRMFSNKYEMVASHHDATNYYTVIPFKMDMLKKEYFANLVLERDLRDLFNEYLYNYVDISKRWYNATKDDYIEFLDGGYNLEFTPVSNSDFLDKYKIQL